MVRCSRLLAAILAVWMVSTSLCRAESPDGFNGTWLMSLDGHNFLVLRISEVGNRVSGTFDSPAHFKMVNSVFSVSPGPSQQGTLDGQVKDSALHLVVRKKADPSDSTPFVMSLKSDHAELALDGLPAGAAVQPWILRRAPQDAAVFTDWNPGRGYTLDDSDTPNARMKALYDEDQSDRQAAPIDWSKVSAADAMRRDETMKLLRADELHTGDDFREAAFIFQHGRTSSDFLLAHVLAMAAMSKGDSSSAWIAAATLDRYLQSAGHGQIFGTQGVYKKGVADMSTPSMPYDSKLIPPELLGKFGFGVAPSHQ